MKKLRIIFIFTLCFFCICGCQKKDVQSPGNFQINGDIASWDAVQGAIKYRLEFVGKTLQKRVVTETKVSLSSLDLPYGSYIVNVQAILANGETAYTTLDLKYESMDTTEKVSSLSGKTMIDGRFVKWMGRTEYNDVSKAVTLFYSASGFEVSFVGTSVKCVLEYSNNYPYIVIVVDDNFEESKRIQFTNNNMTLDLVEFTENDGKEHKVALYKSTESQQSHIRVKKIETNGYFTEFLGYKDRKIEVIGDSVSAGFGNLAASFDDEYSLENTDALKAFPFLVSQALDSELNSISVSGVGLKFSPYVSKNMFDAYKKVDISSNNDWNFSNYIPDLVIVELGTNDGYYIGAQLGTKEEFVKQYHDFLDYIHAIYPNAKILMYYGAMKEQSMYEAYIEIYEEAKLRISDLEILKFEGDARGAQKHPSAESQKEIANALVGKIKEIMNW